MFIVASLTFFAVALAIFGYVFDRFMGVNETQELVQAMAAMDGEPAPTESIEANRRAAGTGA